MKMKVQNVQPLRSVQEVQNVQGERPMREIFLEDRPPEVMGPYESILYRTRWELLAFWLVYLSFVGWLGYHITAWLIR